MVGYSLALVLTLATRSEARSEGDSLLQSLPKRYKAATWIQFVDERKNPFEHLHAFLKAPKKDVKDERSAPAVVKVVARTTLPVLSLLETFNSKDEQVLAEWKCVAAARRSATATTAMKPRASPSSLHRAHDCPVHPSLASSQFAGDVKQIDDDVMLQTYGLPWPFMPRDYLVRCTDRVDKTGHTARCASVESEEYSKRAPEREGAVRGHTETVWRFKAESDGFTSIVLETFVDPRGRLPAWLVDKAGKLASVNIVRSLVKTTGNRFAKANAAGADALADGSGTWSSVRSFFGRLVWG